MDYGERFSDRELERIIDEATIYMCACPAQVADVIRELRKLHRYQVACLKESDTQSVVHRTIADGTAAAHAEMQDCLDRVLDLEGWDRATLCMPEGLRQRRQELIKRGGNEDA